MKGPILLSTIAILFVTHTCNECLGGRIWTIQIAERWSGNVYIAADGTHQGHAIDIINAVCKEAGIDCRMVRSPITDCWLSSTDSPPSGGRGLFRRWFDGCGLLHASIENIHTFKFSQPMFARVPFYVWILKGKTFNAKNFGDQVIGIRSGIGYDEKCMVRQNVNYTKTDSNTVFHKQKDEVFPALKDGKVDGYFGAEVTFTTEELQYIEKAPDSLFYCTLGGGAIMTRKDSDFVAHWNIGLTKLRNNNKYGELCEKSYREHGHRGFVLRCAT